MTEQEEFEFRHRLELEKSAPTAKRGNAAGDLLAGAIRGAGSIGATILTPIDAAARAVGIDNSFIGRRDRREAMTGALQELGADPESLAFKTGKIGAEVAGTLGVGGVLGNAAVRAGVPAAAPIVQAIQTAGMRAGGMTGAGGLTARSIGGAVTGGAAAGLVNPEDAGAGAVIGGALPGAVKVAGEAGKAVGRVIKGPPVPETRRAAVEAANALGLVVPPSQAKPTLVNRALEGFAGKLTTAQNASAKNQPVFNALAKAEIGADDLSREGLSAVRSKANEAYSQLAAVGSFQSDDAFREGVKRTAAMTDALKKDFPELVNADVDKLVEGIVSRDAFNAQGTIEAIKRLRFDGSANRIATDPGKKALGKAQMSIARELEELVDRNLQRLDQPELLGAYREARTTLAKVYDIEKAVNPATFNIDANKLAQINKKSPGRLTGNLKAIADFAGEFKTAAKPVEAMGSLPQVSPLDFAGGAALSGLTANPLYMAGVIARPAARAAALSPMVQNRLATPAAGGLGMNPLLLESIYRTTPVIAAQR